MLLPEPLTPAVCDLRGLAYMPLDVVRLFDSDLFALSTGDEFKAALALWSKSWLQVPAASLPNDDRVLAHLSGAGSKWKKVRGMALRGWVECNDSRLYHPVVAEKAITAWEERLVYRDRKENEAERLRRHREEHKQIRAELREYGVVLAHNVHIETLRATLREEQQKRFGNGDSNAPETRTGALPETELPRLKKMEMEMEMEGFKDQEQSAASAPPAQDQPPVDTSKRGTRLSNDWTLSPELATWAKEQRPDMDDRMLKAMADSFRDFWISKPGKNGTKLDWAATWRNWVRNQRGAMQGSGSTKPSPHLNLNQIDHEQGLERQADGSYRIARTRP